MSITWAIFHDGLLVAKVVGRSTAVRAELRGQRTSVKQIVDRHLDEPRDAHRQARRDAVMPRRPLTIFPSVSALQWRAAATVTHPPVRTRR